MRKALFLTFKLFAGFIALLVLYVIFVPAPADASARAKISGALIEMSLARTELIDRCVKGGWKTGMTYESLGLPEFKPGDYVKALAVRVESPQRAVVAATLMEMRTHIFAKLSTPAIPAGAILEFEVRCGDGVPSAGPSPGTTVPDKYLPRFLRSSRPGVSG